MTFKRTSLIFVLSAVPFFTACSFIGGDKGMFRDRSKDYLGSGAIKPIVIPPHLKSKPLNTAFVIPNVNAKDEFGDAVQISEYVVPRPEAIAEDEAELGVKIQSLGGDRWIFLNVPTSQVWPQTQSFLSENNVPPVKSYPSEGVIETNWVTFKDDPSTKSRYRLHIQKGIHPDTTEIHVTQAQFDANELPIFGLNFEWPEQSHDAEREKWLTDELAAVLALGVSNSAASLMGQAVGGSVKANLGRYKGEPVLRLDLPAVRANASLLHAVKADQFVMYDAIQNEGVFYVGYPYIPKKTGFFSKLAFWRGYQGARPTSPFSIENVLSQLSDKPEVKETFSGVSSAAFTASPKNIDGYLIIVHAVGNGFVAKVRSAQGEKLDDASAKGILRLLRTRLI